MSTEIDNKKSSQDWEIANAVVQECIALFWGVWWLMLAIEGNVMQIMTWLSIAAVSWWMLFKKSINLETIRHPLSTINKKFLKLWGYAQKYNPNQTTAIGTAVTLAGTWAYVVGILSWSPEISLLGIGWFTAGRYADLLDGDHARLLREQGRWNTKSGGILDADMDKAWVFLTLGALIYTNTLPETHKYLIGIEVAIMATLDAWSYRLRSQDRDWRKVIDSLKSGVWDENIDLTEAPKEWKKKIDANAFGKAKTLLQTLWITALWVGALIDNPEVAHNLQKLGHPMFLWAILFASASLVSKLRKK